MTFKKTGGQLENRARWLYGLLLVAGALWGAGSAAASEKPLSLVCDGAFLILGGKPATMPISDISINFDPSGITIHGTLFFDGSYLEQREQGDTIVYSLFDNSSHIRRDIFTTLNRSTGTAVMMNVVLSKNNPLNVEYFNTYFDGTCRKSVDIF